MPVLKRLKEVLRKTSEPAYRIEDRRYWIILNESKVKCYVFFRLSGLTTKKEKTSSGMARRDSEIASLRAINFFNAILRSKIPLVYLVLVRPDKKAKVFDSVSVVGTWSEDHRAKLASCLAKVEEQSKILSTALSIAYPDLSIKRMEGDELEGLIKDIWVKTTTHVDKVDAGGAVERVQINLEAGSSLRKGELSPGFYTPEPRKIPVNGLKLGSLVSEGTELGEMRLSIDDLSKHVCILGMTGSGKTTTAKLIVKRVSELGVPCLVLDVHNEYSNLVRRLGGLVLDPGRGEFSINPMDLSNTTELPEHISLVTDIFSEVFRFTPPQAFMFRNAMTKLLTTYTQNRQPSLQDLVEVLETMPIKSVYDNETRLALLRRLLPLTEGQAWKILSGPTTIPIDKLIKNLVAIELGYIRDSDTRLIFMTLLLKMIRDHAMRSGQKKLSHVIVIEEARYVVPYRRSDSPPSVVEKIINELSKFGVSIMLISQFPSQISHEVIKNSSLKVIHRISWADDIRVLRESLGLDNDQARYLSMLDTGEAVLVSHTINKPILVRIDPSDVLSTENKAVG